MKIKDKSFKILISEKDLLERIASIAKEINEDYKGKAPLFIGILNGSFMFVADMMKLVTLPSKVSFIKLSSYTEMNSTGTVRELLGLNENIYNKDVIILEDIIDSGTTMASVTEEFKERGASSVAVVTLLLKPKALKVKLDIKYVGFEIGNEFVVGYGLDYDGLGRNSGAIYQLKE
jgi:hypoxanthine phosphoribosyltransferase